MKTTKLVLGILTLVFSIVILFQSCAAGLGNAIAENNEISGSAGLFVAILMIAGGIVMISTRRSEKIGGSIAATILFFLGALIGYPNAGSFTDLKIWATLCIILAVVNVISIVLLKKAEKKTVPAEEKAE